MNNLIKTDNVELYGGKANSLIKLKSNNIKVPNFFVVTTELFLNYIKYNNFSKKIEYLYKSAKFDEIKRLVMSGKFSKSDEDFILTNFNKLNAKYVSVRSSAVVEDAKTESCAGQFQTFLNVTKTNLIKSIKGCFASLYSSTVNSYIGDYYRISKGIAVVVQRMIKSKYSGVAFSTDYNIDNKNYMIIEAIKGLGEGLVSGEKTPVKYFVRKSNCSLDKITNKIFNIDDRVAELAKIVNKIEKIYETPMDIEWAIDEYNDLHILQARPIVSFNKDKIYQYTFSRPRPLFETFLNYQVYTKGLEKLSKSLFYLKPLWIFDSKVYKEYSNITNLEEDPNVLTYYIIKNGLISIYNVEQAIKKCTSLMNQLQSKNPNLSKMIDSYTYYEAYNLFSNFLINDNTLHNINTKGINTRLKESLLKNRDFFDEANDKFYSFIKNYCKDFLGKDFEQKYKFLTLDEIINKNNISKETIDLRKKGFILFNNNLYLIYKNSDISNWLKENNILLNDLKFNSISGDTIKGQIAYPGMTTGKVKIVYNEDDFDKIKSGDIIVSPMTVPSFTPILKKAAGIITDDGGTVCHAALLARELKLPCLVGTKFATTMLKDGDIVEINSALSCAIKKSSKK